jgi:UDP-N-acetylmuramoyl-L-alanyl-D-glutamate--2,6-diaminopimelate ligase
VSDTRRAAAVAATVYFDEPAAGLRLVGVTGTNGKTTTVGMLRHLLDEPRARAASIGTLGVLIGGAGEPLDGGSGLTTPGPVELQRVLRALHDGGVRAVAMETSSHALHQRRVEGSPSRPACSPTSRAIISTITARWSRTSRRRRCSSITSGREASR